MLVSEWVHVLLLCYCFVHIVHFFIVFVNIVVLWLSTAYFFLIQKSMYLSIHTLLCKLKSATSYILFPSLLHVSSVRLL